MNEQTRNELLGCRQTLKLISEDESHHEYERYVPFDLDPLMLYFSDVIAYNSEEFDDFLKQLGKNG